MDTLHDDEVEKVRQSLVKLLAIADRLDTRNVQTVQELAAATAALDRGVERLDAGGERFAESALQLIGSRAQQSIASGAAEAVATFQQQMQRCADTAQAAAHAMDEHRRGLAGARPNLVWSGLVALLIGSLLAAGGVAWVAHRSMQDLARAHFGQDILQATRRGVITRCGDSLCAKVGGKPRRYGKDGAYLLLQE
ncbi:hypothetical protein [Rhodanobacter lindaniclasticus]